VKNWIKLPPVPGLRHAVPPVAGPWSSVASCIERDIHTHRHTDTPDLSVILRPYSLSATRLGPPLPPTAIYSSSLTQRHMCMPGSQVTLLGKPRLIFRGDCTLTYAPSPTPAANTTDRGPCDPVVPLRLLASQTAMHTEESPAPTKIKVEFNEKAGQTVLIKYRARPHKPTDQPAVYMRLPPHFQALIPLFSHDFSSTNHLCPSLSLLVVPPLNIES